MVSRPIFYNLYNWPRNFLVNSRCCRVYGSINVLLYHALDIIYNICITTTDVCTHILDLDCVSKIGRDAKRLLN